MNGDDVNLPQADESMFSVSKALELEFRTDPPNILARRLPDDILFLIYAKQLQTLAQVARFESQMLTAKAEMYDSVVKVLPTEMIQK